MVFEDRRDAGRQLAGQLQRFAGERPVIFALPRGGVPVALEVARDLDAPLDLLTVRKLGAPQDPEFAIGAVAEDGTAVVNAAVARQVGVTDAEFRRILEREQTQRLKVAGLEKALARLDERSRRIIEARWLRDKDTATLHDLAAEFGVSAERVRQIESKAMQKMRGLIDAGA